MRTDARQNLKVTMGRFVRVNYPDPFTCIAIRVTELLGREKLLLLLGIKEHGQRFDQISGTTVEEGLFTLSLYVEQAANQQPAWFLSRCEPARPSAIKPY